jgi:hypothetical protein
MSPNNHNFVIKNKKTSWCREVFTFLYFVLGTYRGCLRGHTQPPWLTGHGMTTFSLVQMACQCSCLSIWTSRAELD